MAYEGPAENYDLDFRDLIVAPCATYEDTLVLVHQWDREDARQEVEWAQLVLGAVYRHFGGGADILPNPPSEEDIQSYVWGKTDSGRPYGVAGKEKVVADVVMRYLTGQGDDYEAMNELAAQ